MADAGCQRSLVLQVPLIIKRFPSKPEHQLDLWKSMASNEERCDFLSMAIERGRDDVIAQAGRAPQECRGLSFTMCKPQELLGKIAHNDNLEAVLALADLLPGELVKAPWPGYMSLTAYAVNENASRLFTYMLENGLDPTATISSVTGGVIHHVAERGWVDGMKALLNKHPQAMDFENHRGETALHSAAQTGQIKTVLLLIQLGANIHARNKKGRTPLWRATCGQKERSSAADSDKLRLVQQALAMAGSNPHLPSGISPKTASILKLFRRQEPQSAELLAQAWDVAQTTASLLAHTPAAPAGSKPRERL